MVFKITTSFIFFIDNNSKKSKVEGEYNVNLCLSKVPQQKEQSKYL